MIYIYIPNHRDESLLNLRILKIDLSILDFYGKSSAYS